MNLRQQWDARLEREGRMRLNVYDPDMLTYEDQLEMFGEILSGRGKKREVDSLSRNVSKSEKQSAKDRMLRDLKNLPTADQREIMRILME